MTPEPTDAARQEAGRRRLRAVREQLEQRGLDVLLVCGSGRHDFIGANLCWWLSGVRQVGRDALVALTREGEALLLTMPSWDEARSRRRGWIEDVVAVDDLGGALGDLAARRGWRSARVGVAGAAKASPVLAAGLRDAFAQPPLDADDAVLAVASVHDAWAISLIERAVEVAEAGYRHLREVARPGMPEYELHAEADAHMRALGADDNFLLISASQHNRAVHAPTDRELGIGDVILAEVSPSVEGQFAQICRSAVLGEPTQRQLEAYELLREGYRAGLALAAPGVAVRDVAQAIDDVMIAHGYGEYTKPPYMRTRGHAMGLGAMVPADISAGSQVVLAEGMSFVLHPNQYLPDSGYLLCGDQVVITHDGARALADDVPALGTIEGAVVA